MSLSEIALQPTAGSVISNKMSWRVEIKQRQGIFDSLGESVQKSIQDLDIHSIRKVCVTLVYNLIGHLQENEVAKIGRELLVNPVTQEFSYSNQAPVSKLSENGAHEIEIAYNAGVMDPVEESTIKGIHDLGIKGIEAVHTAKKYILYGALTDKELNTVVNKILSNKIIQHVVDFSFPKSPTTSHQKSFNLILIDLGKANDKQLLHLSQKGQLYLNLEEMKTIQRYFRRIKREPTDVELETIAQTWSEHCYHKTFRGNIRYRSTVGGRRKTRLIKNLLKSTIFKATQEINKSWCVSVFHDNAGVIKFDRDSHVCFKVETHNHPSALEPFGGANTGVGGVIRDILGTGLGAKPICNTDVFCFASPDTLFSALPEGLLHPKRIMKGVVSGVRDYGNKMGIPTVNGAILFDERYMGNPLVYCGCVGIMPKDKVRKKVLKGDQIIVLGGKTGRDGIHGATFSSGELTSESEVISSGAVQIGDPIQEKKVLDALMQARDLGLYTAITDCGAGGLSSAVGEMGKDLGAKVYLERVPLKYQGLTYTEIWISESQERMVISVRPNDVQKILNVFAKENVEAILIGEFTGTKRLELFYKDCQVCDMDMEFLHEMAPKITKEAVWSAPKLDSPRLPAADQLTDQLKNVLSHYNVCSKEWVIRQYDHEVQGGSVVKPLVGRDCDGPSDAAVIAPKFGSNKGIAMANGINARFGMIDPFWMAASCIDEAIRQIIAVGGDLEKIAILDNFCWGNPDRPDRLGSLVRAAEGCYNASVGYRVPFISGKDSLYNEYSKGKQSIAIPGTILISSIGTIDDISKCITMDFKRAGNLIYCVGLTFDELGGSIYLDTLGLLGKSVPQVNTRQGTKIFTALSAAIRKGLVASCHDCSEGGLGAALAEMAFSGGLGVCVHLDQIPFSGQQKRNDTILFSESNSRFLIEVEPKNKKRLESFLRGIPHAQIGSVEGSLEFLVYGLNKKTCVKARVEDLKEAWQKPLRW